MAAVAVLNRSLIQGRSFSRASRRLSSSESLEKKLSSCGSGPGSWKSNLSCGNSSGRWSSVSSVQGTSSGKSIIGRGRISGGAQSSAVSSWNSFFSESAYCSRSQPPEELLFGEAVPVCRERPLQLAGRDR